MSPKIFCCSSNPPPPKAGIKKIIKLASSILLSLIGIFLLQSTLVQIANAESFPENRQIQSSEIITCSLYLPYVNKHGYISSSLIYGIQTDSGNYAANISHVHNINFEWVRFQMPWKEVETSPGNYNWQRWDDTINAYSQAGIKILLCITKAPDWARPIDDNKSVEGLPENPQTYADFVTTMLSRYQGKVHGIEIWKEQNLYYKVGGQGRVDAEKYMLLLKTAYTAIKAEYPEITIISGGLTPTGAPFPVAVDDREYLRQMYALGLQDFSDAIGAHPAGFANPPDALYTGGDYDPNRGYDDHRAFFFRNTMEDYRQIIIESGDVYKPVWATEFGWPVWRFLGDERFEFAKENTLEEQAEYSRRAYEMGKEWGWVGAMFLWNLDYAVTAANTELANFSILTPSGLTPAYEALKDMPK